MKSCLPKVSFSDITFPVLYKKHKWELWWSKQVWNQVKFQLMTLTCAHCRQPCWDVPASDWRQGADGERAQGGRHELHRVEVPHGWGSAGGQSGHGYKASWAEQWVVWTLPVFACVTAREGKWKVFEGCIPGLGALLMLLGLLNSFDTLNWSVACCEFIHKWTHDRLNDEGLVSYLCSSGEERLLLFWFLWDFFCLIASLFPPYVVISSFCSLFHPSVFPSRELTQLRSTGL